MAHPHNPPVPTPPLIAVSPNANPAEDRALYRFKALEYGEAELASAVAGAGGLPLLAYRAGRTGDAALAAHAADVIARCDGLLLSGGVDLTPATYGAAPEPPWGDGDPDRDAFELALYRAALAAGLPILAICRGAQLVNVAEGGTLWQDLSALRTGSLCHRDFARYDRHGHGLALAADAGPLGALFGGAPRWVNSVHHQGVRRLGADLDVLATAPDGVVEAFTHRRPSWLLAVQWHPEWMQDRPDQRRLFDAFVDACRR